jgi:hypothetical protein
MPSHGRTAPAQCSSMVRPLLFLPFYKNLQLPNCGVLKRICEDMYSSGPNLDLGISERPN